ncbi:CHC2 zinc finger [Prevotella sp. tc2-28]|uniref:CHC2 zinc finger domain-containing protein n=1 Tax=Prevotella sp. tc2-28 TaxID=1761888 RepID=UPI000895F57F|nr:CHC2 zinc finger domain-containing protein [Prevotella sp. tc2-28]SEA34845.1 CHC2 zinc finger [Prevotella sp. tc2-28]
MEKYELQKLRDLPIEGVAERLGLYVSRHKCLCPFHDDHHASMSFRVNKNTYRCFVCGASGGPIDLVMNYLRKDFLEAIKWLQTLPSAPPYREGNGYSCNGIYSSPYREGSGVGLFDASRYERFFEHPWLNDEARRFLFDERRLDARVVRWCRLTSWKDRQGVPWLQIPYYNQEGQLIGVQNRNLIKGALPRFRFPQGSRCGVYNLPVLNMLQPGDDLYITEGCSDCWAMLSAGHKAIAIPSATLLTRKNAEQLLSLSLSLTFHMYPDRDAPGERLFLQLREMLPALVHHQLPPDCKDFSEYYLKLRAKN